MKKLSFSLLDRIYRIAVAASRILKDVCLPHRGDVTSTFLQNGSHFLVEKLVLVVDLVLPFFFHSVLAARRLEHLAQAGLGTLMRDWIRRAA